MPRKRNTCAPCPVCLARAWREWARWLRAHGGHREDIEDAEKVARALENWTETPWDAWQFLGEVHPETLR